MSERDGRDKLLDHVLKDEKLEALRQSVLKRSREELAKKRRSPFRWWYVPAAAALLLILVRIFLSADDSKLIPLPPDPRQGMDATPYLVHTAPLVEDQVVHSRTFDELVIETGDYPPALMLTDGEMLAFFEGVPCGLVQRDEGRKALVFLHPEDEDRFVVKVEG